MCGAHAQNFVTLIGHGTQNGLCNVYNPEKGWTMPEWDEARGSLWRSAAILTDKSIGKLGYRGERLILLQPNWPDPVD